MAAGFSERVVFVNSKRRCAHLGHTLRARPDPWTDPWPCGAESTRSRVPRVVPTTQNMAAKPLPPPRAVYHEARLLEVWDLVSAGCLSSVSSTDAAADIAADNTGRGTASVSFSTLKRQLDDLEIDFTTCGLDTAKINRAVFHVTETDPDRVIAFSSFCAFAALHGKPPTGVDPVLETHAYFEKHKLGALFESMTASLMVSKPDDVVAFLVEKLEKLKQKKIQVATFGDDELGSLFDMSDASGAGVISGAKASKGLEVLVGRVPVEVSENPERLITRENFIRLARGLLETYGS
jgi:hypothetical protein